MVRQNGGTVKQHIKELCNVGGRKVIEIYAVVFVVIVTVPVVVFVVIVTVTVFVFVVVVTVTVPAVVVIVTAPVVLLLIYTGGKDIGKYLADERTFVLMSKPSALNSICQSLRVTSPLFLDNIRP